MIIGIGVDVVDLERFNKKISANPKLRERLFTSVERELAVDSLAARFAAKEALIKALGGSHNLGWHDIEVPPSGGSRPVFSQTQKLSQLLEVTDTSQPHLSISHDGGVATAFVVLESRKQNLK